MSSRIDKYRSASAARPPLRPVPPPSAPPGAVPAQIGCEFGVTDDNQPIVVLVLPTGRLQIPASAIGQIAAGLLQNAELARAAALIRDTIAARYGATASAPDAVNAVVAWSTRGLAGLTVPDQAGTVSAIDALSRRDVPR